MRFTSILPKRAESPHASSGPAGERPCEYSGKKRVSPRGHSWVSEGIACSSLSPSTLPAFFSATDRRRIQQSARRLPAVRGSCRYTARRWGRSFPDEQSKNQLRCRAKPTGYSLVPYTSCSFHFPFPNLRSVCDAACGCRIRDIPVGNYSYYRLFCRI